MVVWYERLWRQFKLLIVKNYILAKRNLRSTIVQLCAPIVAIIILKIVELAVSSNDFFGDFYDVVRTPSAIVIPLIPLCTIGPQSSDKTRCYTLGYAPSNDTDVQAVMNIIMEQNGIPSDSVIGFPTSDELDQYLFDYPNTTQGAYVFFHEKSPSTVCLPNAVCTPLVETWNYVLQLNGTDQFNHGQIIRRNQEVTMPMQYAVERAILQYTNNVTLDVQMKKYPHPEVLTVNVVGERGPFWIFASLMFIFVVGLGLIVTEKQEKLREIMKIMGLKDSVYWFSWFCQMMLTYVIAILLMITTGAILQFDFFLNNAFGLYFFLMILFAFSMTTFCFLMSVFVRKASQATSAGFLAFIIGFITQVAGASIFSSSAPGWLQVIFSFFPPVLLAVGLQDLGEATQKSSYPGKSWDQVSEDINNGSVSYNYLYGWLVLDGFIFLVLALYFDNTVPNEYGTRRPWYYFLMKDYWTGQHKRSSKPPQSTTLGKRLNTPEQIDADVKEEEDHVHSGDLPENTSVVIQDLAKVYGGAVTNKVCGCCGGTRGSDFIAVNQLCLSIEQNTLLCLLGPNGAGKTTTIHMLVGLHEPTSGDAVVFGHSIVDDIRAVQDIMGVCPQFDILWPELTGEEHLRLFAGLRGLSPDELETEVNRLLEETSLTSARAMRSSAYSGGMRRRLSVAVSLIGNPKIVFLDEPTTGMDPVSRRGVWNIIEKAKKDKVIVLTTHSMEEADVLGDRIAIMAQGELQCVGSSVHLKQKFGAGYRVTIQTADDEESVEAVLNFLKKNLDKDVQVVGEAFGGFLTVNVSRDATPNLVPFFRLLKKKTKKLKVADVQLSLTTLEQVFLTIAEQAELRALQAGIREQAVVDEADAVALKNYTPGEADSYTLRIKIMAAGYMVLAVLFLIMAFVIGIAGGGWSYLILAVFAIPVGGYAFYSTRNMKAKNATYTEYFILGFAAIVLILEIVSIIVVATTWDSQCEDNNDSDKDIADCKDRRGAAITSTVFVFLISICCCSCCGVFSNTYRKLVNREEKYQKSIEMKELKEAESGQGTTIKDRHENICAKLGEGPRQFAFRDQFSALFKKTFKLQSRDKKTVVCQILTPLFLVLLLWGLQLLVNELIIDADPVDEVVHPPTTTPFSILGMGETESRGGFIFDFLQGQNVIINNLAATGSDALWTSSTGVDLGDRNSSGLLAYALPYEGVAQSVLIQPFSPFNQLGNATFKDFSEYSASINESAYSNPPQSLAALTVFDVNTGHFVFPMNYDIYVDSTTMENYMFDQFDFPPHVVAAYDVTQLDLAGRSLAGYVYSNYSISFFEDMPMIMNRLTGAFAKQLPTGQPGGIGPISMDLLGIKEFPTLEDDGFYLDLVTLAGEFFYCVILHQLLPVFLSNIVAEKELRIKEMMNMMGLKIRIYWLVHYVFDYLMYFGLMIILIIAGVAFQFRVFTINTFLSYFILFALWGHVLIAMSFLLSVFFDSRKTALIVGYFCVLGIALVCNVLVEEFLGDINNVPAYVRDLMSIVPSFNLYRGLIYISAEVSWEGPGYKLDNLDDPLVNLAAVYGWFFFHWVVLMGLWWYLDQVLPSAWGVKKHPLFFLGKTHASSHVHTQDILSTGPEHTKGAYDDGTPLPPDVQKEVDAAFLPLDSQSDNYKEGVVVQGMRKVYPGRDGNPPKSAVKGVSFVVEKQSCLGLLGHNGAGKTTLLNMLIGLFAPSSGTAFIRGLDIRTSLDVIHSMIGICPQHDVLWDNLTGKEHLMFYGRIKGLKGDDLKNEVKYLLEKVKLTSARNKVSKKYSGGMKRRLSVAIALMGAPQVVFLDEPSTGLDPKSRQDLWNVINEYKQHASIILTTHSMEEADALCDRIMIMADGNAKCVGVSADLKGRFGEGYKLSATVQKGANGEDLHKYILSFLPDARLLNELAGTRNYEIPKKGNNVSLDDVFEKMEAKKEELRIQDWAITNTTLEEVFLKISLQNKGNDAAHSVAFFSEDELAISSKKKSKAKINAKTDSNNIDENGKEEQDKDADFSSSSEDEAQEQKDGSIRTDESQELP